MLKRVIAGIIGACIIAPVLWFSDTWVFPIFFAFVTGVSMFEMLRCIGIHKKFYVSIPLILFAAATPIVARLTTVFRDIEGKDIDVIFILLCGAVIAVLWFFAVSLFSNGDFHLGTAAMTFMTSFYIVGGYTAIVMLRDLGSTGKFVFWLVFIGAWSTDIFAYFFGRLLGRHKLMPEISPKKTIAGSLFGVLFCVISYVVYGLILQYFAGIKPHYIVLALVAILISVVAQVGDLVMSHVKRKYGIKDFGKIMPGHGGLLDRFDSI
ncbi:MAG: phosphatidate cytidylyltransferase, partial [Clostridia bacterium]|nr:phosphatidate cytidylyltransferase [Clostridia bacterium]